MESWSPPRITSSYQPTPRLPNPSSTPDWAHAVHHHRPHNHPALRPDNHKHRPSPTTQQRRRAPSAHRPDTTLGQNPRAPMKLKRRSKNWTKDMTAHPVIRFWSLTVRVNNPPTLTVISSSLTAIPPNKRPKPAQEVTRRKTSKREGPRVPKTKTLPNSYRKPQRSLRWIQARRRHSREI